MGRDLKTGAALSEDEARAKEPAGRAHLLGAAYQPSPEQPDDGHPLLLTTGRTVHHFRTRTKTGRAPELQAAAPDVWAELSAADARTLGVEDGDRVRIASARGELRAPVRITGTAGPRLRPVPLRLLGRRGRQPPRSRRQRADAHRLDPASKQPQYKLAAVSELHDSAVPCHAPADSRDVALILIAFAFPLQLATAVFGYLARDVSPAPAWASWPAPGCLSGS